MRQVQFKFDPLPADSAEICLFHERWIKTFYTQPFCQCALNMSQYFRKLIWSNFATIIWQVLHKKNSFWELEKQKMNMPEFVFFTRGGSKTFTPNHFVNCALNMAQYLIKLISSNFATNIRQVLNKKTHFGTQKMENEFSVQRK